MQRKQRDVVPYCGRRKLDEMCGVNIFAGTWIKVCISRWKRGFKWMLKRSTDQMFQLPSGQRLVMIAMMYIHTIYIHLFSRPDERSDVGAGELHPLRHAHVSSGEATTMSRVQLWFSRNGQRTRTFRVDWGYECNVQYPWGYNPHKFLDVRWS